MGNRCFAATGVDVEGANTKKINSSKASFYAIQDRYRTIEEVQEGLRAAGLESSNLILGIDYTQSNTWTGKNSFGARCLHDTTSGYVNPYQAVINIVGRTLEVFDDDKLIPTFGFGDSFTQDKAVFSFFPSRPCQGFTEVLNRYNEITPGIVLSGPTNFGPLIRKAIEIVKESRGYHILVIIADGQVTSKNDTAEAIVEASNFPLSIIVVGVGDGPWEMMQEFDDELPERKFDNFQFVPFNTIMSNVPPGINPDTAFATAALMEVPDQYKLIRSLNLL